MEKQKTQSQIFEYTYSGEQQNEIKKIREKYLAKDQNEDKLEQLRRLDRNVTSRGTCAAIILGVLGTLLLGGGLSLVLVWRALFPGAVIGGIGVCLIGAAYPVFQYITRKQKEKIAPQILRLTEELMK